MKKVALFLTGFLVFATPGSLFANSASPQPFTPNNTKPKELLFRTAPLVGMISGISPGVLDAAVKRFIITAPTGSFEFQINEHWFFVASFNYIYFSGKPVNGFTGNGHVLAPTGGFRLVSSTTDATTGHFFDDTRWWLDIEAGLYMTKLNSRLVNNRDDTNLGFNVSIGADRLFSRHWGIGLQTKLHYANYSLDDYLVLAFGPHLITRF